MIVLASLSLLSTLVCVQQNTVAMPMRMNPALPLQLNCSVQKQNGTLIILYTYVPSGGIFQGLLQGVSASEDDLPQFLLSFILLDEPMMTEEQVELKQAMMMDEERAEALTDLFGKQCTINTHANKKARKNLGKNDIAFLVVQSKCHAPDKISDACLEQFLQCEGMNAKVCLEV